MAELAKMIAGHAELSALYRFWQEQCAGRPMPTRAEFDPTLYGDWPGNMHLVQVSRDPLDFHYRVFATNIAGHVGRDMTGKSIKILPDDVYEAVIDSYRKVAETGMPVFSHHDEPNRHGAALRHDRLLLPLGQDGVVDHILVGAYPVEPSRES